MEQAKVIPLPQYEECPDCKGEGTVEKTLHIGEEGMQLEMDAPCTCQECGGSGKLKIQEII